MEHTNTTWCLQDFHHSGWCPQFLVLSRTLMDKVCLHRDGTRPEKYENPKLGEHEAHDKPACWPKRNMCLLLGWSWRRKSLFVVLIYVVSGWSGWHEFPWLFKMLFLCQQLRLLLCLHSRGFPHHYWRPTHLLLHHQRSERFDWPLFTTAHRPYPRPAAHRPCSRPALHPLRLQVCWDRRHDLRRTTILLCYLHPHDHSQLKAMGARQAQRLMFSAPVAPAIT